VALAITTYLPAFPPVANPTFKLLKKMDYVFASLVSGRDVDSQQVLPGFERGQAMSRTDMVRCRSLVEGTRVLVVEVMGREPEGPETAEETGGETDEASEDDTEDMEGIDEWQEDDDLAMEVARVYERTIVALNKVLSGATAFDVGNERS
jgi:hypothetical protein